MEYKMIKTCPSCKSCEDCPYFEKVDIKSDGLSIYRHSICRQGVNNHTEQIESFILHNTKNIDVNSEKLISKLGQYKKCPRCKYILEHAEKLLLNIPTINKLDVLGICDKCWAKDRQRFSACVCSEAIEKFIAIKKYKEKESTESKQTKHKMQKLTKPLSGRYRREPRIGQLKREFQESLTEKYLDRPSTQYFKKEPTNHDKEPSILDLIADQNRSRKEYSKLKTLEFKAIDTQLKRNRGEEKYNVMNEETRIKSNSTISLPSSKSLSDTFPFTYLTKTKDFSYFFIKDAERTKKPIQKLKSSSELIKDTQNMLRARQEKLVTKNEENLQHKLFDEGKSRLGREEDKNKKSFTKTQPKIDTMLIKELKKVKSDKVKQQKEDISRLKADRKLKRVKAEQSRKGTETLEIKTKDLSRKDTESRKKNKEEVESAEKIKITPEQVKMDKSSSAKQKLDKDSVIKEKDIERHLTKTINKAERVPLKKDREMRINEREISMKDIKIEQEREHNKLKLDKDEQKGGTKKEKPKKGTEQEVDIKKLHSSVWKKAVEDAASKLKLLQAMDEWNDFEVEPKIQKPERKVEKPFRELNINQIKIMKPSCDDLILQLVKIKQQDVKDKKQRAREISEIQIPRLLIEDHRGHKGLKKPNCIICNDSELELDIEEIINKDGNLAETDIIMGQKILKCKLQLSENFNEKQAFPIYRSTFNDDFTNDPNIDTDEVQVEHVRKPRSASEKHVNVPI